MNINSMTLQDLAIAIQEQADAKEDYVVKNKETKIEVVPTGIITEDPMNDVAISVEGTRFIANANCNRQLATYLDIPTKFYGRLQEQEPDILQTTVNRFLSKSSGRRMIRTLKNGIGHPTARAWLSDQFLRIDNVDVASAALGAIFESGSNMDVVSSNVGESMLYLQCRFPKVEGEVKKGDIVQGGFILKNGECGDAALSIEPIIYRLVCLNGMTVPKAYAKGAMRRTHLGSKILQGEGSSLYKLDTMQASAKALGLQLRDSIAAMTDRSWFDAALTAMQTATEGPQIEEVVPAVEKLAKAFTFSEKESNGVLEHLIKGGDMSKWGAVNAVTSLANDVDSYDRAVELQEVGGKLLDLPTTQWQRITEAA